MTTSTHTAAKAKTAAKPAAKVVKKAAAKPAAKPVAKKATVKPVASAKKPVVKATPAATKKALPVKAKKVAKVEKVKPELHVTPIKEKMNRTQMLQHFADSLVSADLAENERKAKGVVKHLLQDLEDAILGSIHHRGVGEFTLPGLFKIITKKMPARPARKMISPLSGEEITTKPKPASIRVKVRPLAKMKQAAAK